MCFGIEEGIVPQAGFHLRWARAALLLPTTVQLPR